jgi:NAD(P)-dependent dehydrogenase (short-subunit alcohol dehydrogenase family)
LNFPKAFQEIEYESEEFATWFITGCSSGFGREPTKVVLARGYRAGVTARNTKQVEDLVVGHEDRTLALPLDVETPHGTRPPRTRNHARRIIQRSVFAKLDNRHCLI